MERVEKELVDSWNCPIREFKLSYKRFLIVCKMMVLNELYNLFLGCNKQ